MRDLVIATGNQGKLVEIRAALEGLDFRILGAQDVPGGLPEESENAIVFTVNPLGEVVDARLERASGYVALDEHILSRARLIRFAALAPGLPQENQTVRLPVSFKFNGAVLSGAGQP
jgi:TonB family protein